MVNFLTGTTRILPILESTSWPATVSWMLTEEQETLGSETKDFLLLGHQVARTLCSPQFSLSPRFRQFSSVQFISITQSCPTLCDPIDCSMPGFLVRYQLPEFTQTHVHRVSDSIQLSHPLSSPSSAFNLSQHQGLFPMSQFFASGGPSIGALVLPMNIQDWFPLGLTGLISLQSKRLSRVFSNTTVRKHQFFSAQFSL